MMEAHQDRNLEAEKREIEGWHTPANQQISAASL
jgi:hypothetical protein